MTQDTGWHALFYDLDAARACHEEMGGWLLDLGRDEDTDRHTYMVTDSPAWIYSMRTAFGDQAPGEDCGWDETREVRR